VGIDFRIGGPELPKLAAAGSSRASRGALSQRPEGTRTVLIERWQEFIGNGAEALRTWEAESAGTMKTFNSIEHNRLKVVGGSGQNTVESIKDRLVGPEFLTSDDPAQVFHDKLNRDVKRLLGETDLSGIVIAERRAAIMPARKPAPTQRRSRPSPR
jgi:hypothetical protein